MCAEVMEVDSDGDFRLRNDANIESGFLFRAEFVYIASTDDEVAAPVPEQKMRASLVDKSAVGVLPINENEGEVKAAPIEEKAVPTEVKAAPIEEKTEPKLAPTATPTSTAECFEVLLNRNDSADKVGLHLDMSDETALEVINVLDGLVKSYNSTVPQSKQVNPGHYVVAINDSPPKGMLGELSASKQIKLKIAPQSIATVQLTKTAGGTLGMSLKPSDEGGRLTYMGCAPGSVMDTYNKSASKEDRVDTGNRIIEVNGASDLTKMMEALKSATTLTLKVARPVR
jgi:hypothetical protein